VLAPSLYEAMLRSRRPGEVFRPGQREECRVRCAYRDGTHSVPYLLVAWARSLDPSWRDAGDACSRRRVDGDSPRFFRWARPGPKNR